MITRLGGWLLWSVAGAALAQAQTGATKPQLYIQYALPGDLKPRKIGPVVVDPPLKLTIDASGIPHLGVTDPPPPSLSFNGTVIGSETKINLVAGPGVTITGADTNGAITIQISATPLKLPNGCVVDANNNTLCPSNAVPIPTSASIVIVTDEAPLLRPDGTWSVVGIPTDQGVACFKDSVYQTPPADYTLAGNIITAPAWLPSDPIRCEYKYFDLAK